MALKRYGQAQSFLEHDFACLIGPHLMPPRYGILSIARVRMILPAGSKPHGEGLLHWALQADQDDHASTQHTKSQSHRGFVIHIL